MGNGVLKRRVKFRHKNTRRGGVVVGGGKGNELQKLVGNGQTKNQSWTKEKVVYV